MFKKIIIFLIFIIFSVFLFSPINTYACSVGDQTTGWNTLVNMLEDCQEKWISVKGTGTGSDIGISWLKAKAQSLSVNALQYAGLFAVGAIVWAGIQYTTAYGDSAKLESAKKTAIFAAVGLLVALISFSLVNAVLYFLFNL